MLSKADQVRLTAAQWQEGLYGKRFGSEEDASFRSVLAALSSDLISVEVSRFRYNDVMQPAGEYQHYYYRLSAELKGLLDRQTLLWGSWNWGSLYGFEDPTFYSASTGTREMVGSVISHEPLIYLYLDLQDYEAFSTEHAIQWNH